MKLEQFYLLEGQYRHLMGSWSGGLWSLIQRVLWTGLALWLSLSGQWALWLLGQLILGFALFHWFSILHDCGHNAFFPNRKVNEITGLLASMICFVPFSSWKYVHLEHHKWTGWLDQDPSTRDLLKVTPMKKRLAIFAWKTFLPFFAFAFLLGTFWNVRKLFGLFKKFSVRLEIVLNLLVILVVHFLIAWTFGHWWQMFGLGFIFFGVICEPIILSQHVHIPMKKYQPNPVVFALHEQDQYTRAIVFPLWISRYFTLSFENHIAHHFFPWIPSYFLFQVKTQTGNEVPAFEWIRAARKIPGDILVFEDRNTTKLNI